MSQPDLLSTRKHGITKDDFGVFLPHGRNERLSRVDDTSEAIE